MRYEMLIASTSWSHSIILCCCQLWPCHPLRWQCWRMNLWSLRIIHGCRMLNYRIRVRSDDFEGLSPKYCRLASSRMWIFEVCIWVPVVPVSRSCKMVATCRRLVSYLCIDMHWRSRHSPRMLQLTSKMRLIIEYCKWEAISEYNPTGSKSIFSICKSLQATHLALQVCLFPNGSMNLSRNVHKYGTTFMWGSLCTYVQVFRFKNALYSLSMASHHSVFCCASWNLFVPLISICAPESLDYFENDVYIEQLEQYELTILHLSCHQLHSHLLLRLGLLAIIRLAVPIFEEANSFRFVWNRLL